MGQVLLLLVVALTVAAVVFGVTVLVTGADPGLGEVEPDGRAVPLPGNRPLQESDLEKVRFDTALRGYRMAQVDQALRRAAYDIGYKDELIGVLQAEVAALRAGRISEADELRRAREEALAPSGAVLTAAPVGTPAPAAAEAAPRSGPSTPERLEVEPARFGGAGSGAVQDGSSADPADPTRGDAADGDAGDRVGSADSADAADRTDPADQVDSADAEGRTDPVEPASPADQAGRAESANAEPAEPAGTGGGEAARSEFTSVIAAEDGDLAGPTRSAPADGTTEPAGPAAERPERS
jgi:DivIVA domain-containing protein